ncbi:MAG: hypothetical protein KAX80_01515 [Planctomycetes bacterium]|nr:hypothetical protein [Planctomycetota bacterium]
MSGAAKAFVVINLVFAVLFVGATASYLAERNREREDLDKLQVKYDEETGQLKTQASRLEQEKTNLTSQVDDLSDAKARLEARASSAEKDLDMERKNRLELDARLTALDNHYSELKRDYGRLATRNELLSAEVVEAKKTAEAAVAAKEDAVDRMREAEMRAKAATTRYRETAKQLQGVSKDLARYKASWPDPGGKYTPADVYGKVERVDPKFGIVVISVGEDDGVSAGMEFTVYRDEGYVGKVVVTEVDKELSVARVDKSVSDDVKVGDNVSAAF